LAAGGRLRLKLVGGDVNGFLGLALDNLSVLALLAALLIGGFGVPASIVFGRMFPGTALGVLVGDLLYTWLALRLARRTGRDDVTSMPFGLDTPSTIGMALLVLGPAFTRLKASGLDAESAALETWYLGMASTVIMGAVKTALAFAGRRVQRLVPQAGLLGSLAGIALMLIGFLPLVELFDVPIVGLLTLGLVLYALVAGGRIPGRVPGVLFAVIVGTLVYYALGRLGIAGMAAKSALSPELGFALPHADAHILEGFRAALTYLPLTLPFALVTVIGGVNNTESARVSGDDYDARSILLAEAAATLAAGLAGGVAQTTPYIGHSAYKRMGARAGYTLLTGVFVGLGGVLGVVAHIVEFVPIEALAPVTVFIAVDITVQAFRVVPVRHAPAVAVSFFPSIARMLTIQLQKPEIVPPERFLHLMQSGADALAPLAVVVALGNGFILTATLWGAFVVEMTEGRLRRAALYLFAGAVLCAFGIIHSVRSDGSAYWLGNLDGGAYDEALQFCLAYAGLGVALLALSLQRPGVARPS
jgi:adenine/guanine/hypoxanthine permease